MRTALLALLFALSIQAQPNLQIVTGLEHQAGFPGLAGLRPSGSDRRCMTIAWINGSRVLAFNLEIWNSGDQPFAPRVIRPDLVYDDWWSGGVALMGFWRFSLLDTNGVLVAPRRTMDARFVVWDLLAWDDDASSMTFGPWGEPGISPGRVAFVSEPFTGWSYVPCEVPPGDYRLKVEVDPFNVFGQHSSVEVPLRIRFYQITFLPIARRG